MNDFNPSDLRKVFDFIYGRSSSMLMLKLFIKGCVLLRRVWSELSEYCIKGFYRILQKKKKNILC